MSEPTTVTNVINVPNPATMVEPAAATSIIRNTETGQLRAWPTAALEYIAGWEVVEVDPSPVALLSLSDPAHDPVDGELEALGVPDVPAAPAEPVTGSDTPVFDEVAGEHEAGDAAAPVDSPPADLETPRADPAPAPEAAGTDDQPAALPTV